MSRIPQDLRTLEPPASYIRLNRESAPKQYLSRVRHNIVAEYQAFVNQGKLEVCMKFKIKHQQNLASYDRAMIELLSYSKGVELINAVDTLAPGDLLHHLIYFQGNVYIIENDRGTMATQLYQWPKHLDTPNWSSKLFFHEIFDQSNGDVICVHDMGYIGDMINECCCCDKLLSDLSKGIHNRLLMSISSPFSKRRPVPYARKELSIRVPINPIQLSILRNLQYDVEGNPYDAPPMLLRSSS